MALFVNPFETRAEEEQDLPVVKLMPQIRSDEPQVEVFSTLDCEQLSHFTPQSTAQQRALAERKKQCLHQYRQFIPNTGLR
jgi:hypothetical protein